MAWHPTYVWAKFLPDGSVKFYKDWVEGSRRVHFYHVSVMGYVYYFDKDTQQSYRFTGFEDAAE